MRVDPRSLDTVIFQIQSFAPDSCAVLEGHIAAGVRSLMRFDSILANFGMGDLRAGAPADHPGLFEFGTCHGHYHLRGYVDFRLWTPSGYTQWRKLRASKPDLCAENLLSGHAALASQMVAGHKQGFCAIDAEDVCGTSGHGFVFGDCDLNQGISTGWSDIYSAGTEGNWIDITGFPSGTYVLEMEVNPLRLVVESNYTNNSAAKVVAVP